MGELLLWNSYADFYTNHVEKNRQTSVVNKTKFKNIISPSFLVQNKTKWQIRISGEFLHLTRVSDPKLAFLKIKFSLVQIFWPIEMMTHRKMHRAMPNLSRPIRFAALLLGERAANKGLAQKKENTNIIHKCNKQTRTTKNESPNFV